MKRKWKIFHFRVLIQKIYNRYFKSHRRPANTKIVDQVYEFVVRFKFFKYICFHNIQHLLLLILFSISLTTSTATSKLLTSFALFSMSWLFILIYYSCLFNALNHFFFGLVNSFCGFVGVKTFKPKRNIKK